VSETIVIEIRPAGSGNNVTASGVPKGVTVEVRDYGNSLAGREVKVPPDQPGAYTYLRFEGGESA
jgi:hypothetical protein